MSVSSPPFARVHKSTEKLDAQLGPKPEVESANSTHIQDMKFENFVGIIDECDCFNLAPMDHGLTLMNSSPDYFEGSCISDPCWYDVEGATGKEAIIFDLYPDTGKLPLAAYSGGAY